MKLTVVDNGSTDGLLDWLREQPVELIENGQNLGIAAACNKAWIKDEPYHDYVVKFDSDVLVRRSTWLTDLIKFSNSAKTVGLVAHLAEPDNARVCRPGEMSGTKAFFTCGTGLGGACVLVPRRVWQLCGFWPDVLRPYSFEDAIYTMLVRFSGFINCYLDPGDDGPYVELLSAQEDSTYTQWKLTVAAKNTMFFGALLTEMASGKRLSID